MRVACINWNIVVSLYSCIVQMQTSLNNLSQLTVKVLLNLCAINV